MRKSNLGRVRHSHAKQVNIINIYNTIQLNDKCQYIEHMNNYQRKEDEKCLDKE